MLAFVVDIGGTHISCGIVRNREILGSQILVIKEAARMNPVLPTLSATLHALAEEQNLPLDKFAGIAMGFCGLVNRRTGRVICTSGKYEDAPSLDLKAWARGELRLPLFLENDARLALLGEHYAGAAIGFDDVVMVTLGTGIGGAAMMDGRLLIGKHFQAGCLGGHLPCILDGAICSCGAIGCAESETAGWCLPRVCREWPGYESSLLAYGNIDFEALFQCADAGDAVAQQVQDRCLRIWSANAVALIHAYDPEIVVFGGGVMLAGDRVVRFVQDYVAQYAWTPWGKVQVRAAELGNEAPLLGAVPLILECNQEALDVR